jgi:hypothetical protein
MVDIRIDSRLEWCFWFRVAGPAPLAQFCRPTCAWSQWEKRPDYETGVQFQTMAFGRMFDPVLEIFVECRRIVDISRENDREYCLL